MIVGDPLLHVQHRLRLPGEGRYRNPAHRTASKLIAICIAAVLAAWVGLWLMRDPMPACIDLPQGFEYPRLDYRNNTWWLDGRVIGHSATEDAECILPG